MRVSVNGEPVDLPDDATLLDVLRRRGREDVGVAVAVNLSVVPRAGWGERRLAEGDRIDIVTAVGGG